MLRVMAILALMLVGLPFAGRVVAADGKVPEAWLSARDAYYACIDGGEEIDSTIALFQQLAQEKQDLAPVARTYIGSLTAFKATRTPWPREKLALVKQGLQTMDEGLADSGGNLEAVFIHATTCYHLPFFFGRRDDARRGFATLLQQLPDQAGEYDPELIHYILTFIEETGLLKEGG